MKKDPNCADVFAGPNREVSVMRDCSQCLTRTRCGHGGHLLVHKNRLMNLSEMQMLQGIPKNRLHTPAGVSERQHAMAVGNAFTVTIFIRVLARVLKCTGLRDVEDPFDV